MDVTQNTLDVEGTLEVKDIKEVLETISLALGVDVFSKSRKTHITKVRQICSYILRNDFKVERNTIAEAMGIDRSSTYHYDKTVAIFKQDIWERSYHQVRVLMHKIL